MALLPRSLCIILIFWMVGSRPSATIQAGSPVPGARWGAKTPIHDAANRLRAAGDLAGLEALFSQALATARRQSSTPDQIVQLISLGNVHLLQFRYSSAISEYLEARNLAQVAGDDQNLGLISLNLCSLYQQLGDTEDALATAQAARAAMARTGPTYFQPQLLLMLARFYSSRGDRDAESLFLAGIEGARSQRDVAQEAQGWDLLGEARLSNGDMAGAERALVESYRLRLLHHPSDLRFSYRRLGSLRLAQALQNEPNSPARAVDLKFAMLLTEKALAGSHDAKSTLGSWQLLHQLGQIEDAQGRSVEALRRYRDAVDEAALWWRTLPAADTPLTNANAALHHQVFDSFVEAAARRALHTGEPRLAAESFMAEEFNRALSLRETEALAPVWRSKLPPAYWTALSQLREEDARELRGGGDPGRAERLRLKISEMETLAGIGFSLSKDENFRSPNSLSHFQGGLKESEVLLSFHLGIEESYLWAVTRSSLYVYRLRGRDEIGQRVRKFREALGGSGETRIGIPGKSENVERLGSELYADLFGQLSEQVAAHPAWLIAAEEPLFDVPFAALVRAGSPGGSSRGKAEYLVERNSVQVVPGALLLRSASGRPQASGRLVAVGDPVYNVADSRFPGSRVTPVSWFRNLWPQRGTADGQLSRLMGSAQEVQASVQSWTGSAAAGSRVAEVLTGTTAGRRQFLEALEPPPAAIHLATHVLTPAQRPEQAFLAFSADSTGRPELLATSDIAMLRVQGSLVVMSGCSTAAGEAREGAGLLGLTRAWLMAGASGTIATAWPVEDSAGELLPAFYRYWRTDSTAEALRRSQLDMIGAGDWRAAPSYWAAYRLTGGDR